MNRSAAIFLAVAAVSFSAAAQDDVTRAGRMMWKLSASRDYQGAVVRGAAEGDTIWLATRAALYAVRGEKAAAVSKRPHPDAHLLLAPGGQVYSWLIPIEGTHGLNHVELHFTDGRAPVRLEAEREGGYSGVILGYRGNLVVTIVPLRDPEGVDGPFRYTFWSADGKRLNSIEVPDVTKPELDPEGKSLLLLGRTRADAYSPDGARLWSIDGGYRRGAIAGGGAMAMLNPAKGIQGVLFVRNGRAAQTARFRTPVHLLTIAPGGVAAMVIGSRGAYAWADPASGRIGETKQLAIEERLSYVFQAAWLARDMVALGVLHPADKSLRRGWPWATVIAVDRGGRARFQRTFRVNEPLSGEPGLATEFGSLRFLAFTREDAFFAQAQ